MASVPADSSGRSSNERLDRFEAELQRALAGRPKPALDRLLERVSLLAITAGLVVCLIGLTSIRNSATDLDQRDGLALVLVGLAIVVVGCVAWLRFSMGRYLRYWILRIIHERRTD